jgi:hypothetical protein
MPLLNEIALLASDNGEGLVGETDDKIITFFSLGVVVFFVVAVVLLSALQGRLERRKEERKAAELRRSATAPRRHAAPGGTEATCARRDLHPACSRPSRASM